MLPMLSAACLAAIELGLSWKEEGDPAPDTTSRLCDCSMQATKQLELPPTARRNQHVCETWLAIYPATTGNFVFPRRGQSVMALRNVTFYPIY